MGDVFCHRRTSLVFLWRCVRIGMWRDRRVRQIVGLWWLRRVPILRRRLTRQPEDIMRAAAARLPVPEDIQ